jgi:hypothetical protein
VPWPVFSHHGIAPIMSTEGFGLKFGLPFKDQGKQKPLIID